MENNTKCPLCGSAAWSDSDSTGLELFKCPVCGRFELNVDRSTDIFDINHLAAYLFYHCFNISDSKERRYYSVESKEICDGKRKYFEADGISDLPVHINSEMVEAWYPKSFSEKMDYILLYLYKHTRHVGQYINFTNDTFLALFFVDRYEINEAVTSDLRNNVLRDSDEQSEELRYMIQYFEKAEYITYGVKMYEDQCLIRIEPCGYKRIDELQKYSSNGRNVLVAMKFGEDTRNLREAIRKGIQNAGYIAIFIDEVQHNEFITPELLKYIRDSKFVVVDLTHENNGAYFEEGYAMGLGKTVIQLCKKDTKLHFDIAQKNTIMWASEDDIPEMLKNRIKATID